MRKSPRRAVQKALPRQELRRSLLRIAALIGAIGFVWWIGWHSKWARADATVVVEALDAPQAQPVAVTEDGSPSSEGEQAVTTGKADDAVAGDEPPAAEAQPARERTGKRRGNRTHRETRDARPENGGAVDTPLD